MALPRSALCDWGLGNAVAAQRSAPGGRQGSGTPRGAGGTRGVMTGTLIGADVPMRWGEIGHQVILISLQHNSLPIGELSRDVARGERECPETERNEGYRRSTIAASALRFA